MNLNQKNSEPSGLRDVQIRGQRFARRVRTSRTALTVMIVTVFVLINLLQTVSITLADDGLSNGMAARVANTDGDKLRMRDNPTATAATVTMIDANEVVVITGGLVKDKQGNSFYKISYNGKTGYAMSNYLISAGKATKNLPTLAVGSPAKIANTNGDGVNLRQQANSGAPVLAVLTEDTLITVMGGPFTDKQNNSFYRVDFKGQLGYVTIAYVANAPKNVVTSGGGGFLKIANTDGDPIRFRSGPGRTFDSAGYLYEGQVVKELGTALKDDSGNKWYRVEQGGTVGFIDASFVVHTDSQATAPAPAPAPAKAAPAPVAPAKPKAPVIQAPASNGPLGSRLINYANQFLGWRYVWGGHSPDAGGFDCAGFVHWVLSQNGVSAGYSAADDVNVGKPVPLNALQPGDVLIFSNTYMPGPSHAGIYLGGGRFIHAENESSGVTITSLSDEYYASRLTAARRP